MPTSTQQPPSDTPETEAPIEIQAPEEGLSSLRQSIRRKRREPAVTTTPSGLEDSKPYEASGGDSELRRYKDGAKLVIESQEDGYVVAWSADASAPTFMRAVRELVGAATEAELAPPIGARVLVPFDEADAAISEQPGLFSFVTVEAAEDSFIWSAVDPDTPFAEPGAPGQVAVAFSAFNRTLIAKLIEDTAPPQVRSDLDGILASAKRLTHSSSASA